MKRVLSLRKHDLFASTGEDKLDDLNFVIGISRSIEDEQRRLKYDLLEDFLESNHGEIAALLGYDFTVFYFPKLFVANIRISGILERKRFDKQGKSMGLAFVDLLLGFVC